MSDSSIMSVREMIDTCFGEPDVNIVNFKLMQTILYLLARQQRLLERKVAIEFDTLLVPRTSSLSITEVKLKAKVDKKKQKLTKSGGTPTTGDIKGRDASAKSKSDKSKADKTSSKSTTDETTTSTEKTLKQKAEARDAISKSAKDKASKSTTDETTTSTEKTLKQKAEAKDAISKSAKDKASTFKSMAEPSASEKSTSKSTDKGDASKSKKDKSSKSTADKTSTLKSTTEPSTSDKSTSKSTDQTSTSRKTDSYEKGKASSDKGKTSKGKTRDGEDEAISGKSKKRFSPQDYSHLLDLIEQQREQELRVINQRADSREVAEITPTPMTSLDSMEVQYEKLLVVERLPIDEVEKKIGHLRAGKVSQLDVVTKEKFDELKQLVKEMQAKFGLAPVGTAEFPENMQLMEDLRRGASLTDAMAALQLSARLQAVEKTLKLMDTLITDLAVKKGVKVKQKQDPKLHTYAVQLAQINVDTPETKVIYDAPSGPSNTSGKSGRESQPPLTETEDPITGMLEGLPISNNINMEDLDDAMQELYDELIKNVGLLTNKAISKADEALRTSCRIETKLDAAMDVDERMEDLETLVSEYAAKINALDASLSSQMSNYQEQLTQMQHDLEGGLEAMAEALANPPGETPGASELTANFANVQVQLEITNVKQNDLKENQLLLSLDVQALWKEIELLREVKSDRDEVADALRDKAGLGALNGLVTQQQFDAVRGDFEQRIGASYDKFNNQEIVWQKIIDDLFRELNEKADWIQVNSLRDDISNNLEKLRNKINAMTEIVGEPRAATISRRLFRDAACLSCATPAQMNLEEPTLLALPAFSKASTRPPTIGAEDTTQPKEDGDHGLCYPGLPIPHPRDPRSHVCRRYCGGSHTAVRGALSRAPAELTISNLHPETTGIGSDGKVYRTDEQEIEKKPCLPCNMPPHVSQKEKDSSFELDSETARFYVLPVMTSADRAADNVSLTPPPPVDDD